MAERVVVGVFVLESVSVTVNVSVYEGELVRVPVGMLVDVLVYVWVKVAVSSDVIVMEGVADFVIVGVPVKVTV